MSDPILVQQIQLKLIKPNPANRLITQEMIDEMAESLDEFGLFNSLKVRPQPDGTYFLYSGHVRLAGALKLGWQTIACIVSDKSPEDTVLEGIWDNRQNRQSWLDDYRDIEALEAANPNPTNEWLAKKLKVAVSTIYRGKRVLRCLNQASRDLINQNLKKTLILSIRASEGLSSKWELTEAPVYRLTSLETPELVFRSLQTVIAHQLNENQTQAMVEAIQAGASPEAYTPVKTPPKVKKAPAEAKAPPAAHTAKAVTAHSETTPPGSSAPSEGPADVHSAPPNGDKTAQSKHGAQPETAPQTQVFWKWLAGISFIGQIRSKLKKGEPLSSGEKILVLGWRGAKAIGWLCQHGFKLSREAFKIGWKLLKKADKFVEKLLGKKISNWVRWAVAILFIWGLWVEYHHNPLHQLKVLVSKTLSTAWASSPVEISPKGKPAPPRMAISSPQPTGISSSVAAQPTPVEEAVSTAITASGKKMKMASPAVQPTASPQVTPVKKTDIAGDVLKAAPAGVDVAKKLFGL